MSRVGSTLPSASAHWPPPATAIKEEIGRTDHPVEWVAVYDVGQGNANGICDGAETPLIYFDLGGGVTQNAATFPTALTDFCYARKPPVVLSHWDWDHWSAGARFNAASKLKWIVPNQWLGGVHATFAAGLYAAGNLLVWPAGLDSISVGQVTILKYSGRGKGRNHTGLAIEVAGPNGQPPILLAGDARYSAIPGSLISHRIQQWRKSIEGLQRGEFDRIRNLIAERNKVMHAEASPILLQFDRGELTFSEASRRLKQEKTRIDAENEDVFAPYIGALESLKESIDLEHLAAFGLEEANDMRAELDRLNSLAQLGIAVEIVGHELQAYDDVIGAGLRRLPPEIRGEKAARDIEFGYEGLTDQLRFLSPLRLAGQKIQRWVTGAEIGDYVAEFFKLQLANNRIVLNVTEAFRSLRVFDQQSRLYPVFINLLNNSIYWVATSDAPERTITLDVVDERVIVGDSGPGVDREDVDRLFSLFFTRKARGGRGGRLLSLPCEPRGGGAPHTVRGTWRGAGDNGRRVRHRVQGSGIRWRVNTTAPSSRRPSSNPFARC